VVTKPGKERGSGSLEGDGTTGGGRAEQSGLIWQEQPSPAALHLVVKRSKRNTVLTGGRNRDPAHGHCAAAGKAPTSPLSGSWT